MAYETFSGSSRGGAQPKISLRKSESIGINSAAMEEFFDEDDEYAKIHHDTENDKLAIETFEEKVEKSYKISRSASGGTIAPTSDLKAKGLVPDVTTQYAPEIEKVNQNTEYVRIRLDEPISTHGSPDSEEDGKPEKLEITEEDLDEEDVEIEQTPEQ